MRQTLLMLPLLAMLGACETTPRPYNPVEDVRYSALGQDPFWLLTIGDDRIVLRTGEGGEVVWPRTLPRTWEGVTSWEAGEGTQVISVEARRGACRDSRGRVFEDEVRIRLSGRELNGCGGRILDGAQD